jgi:hypothetical protein
VHSAQQRTSPPVNVTRPMKRGKSAYRSDPVAVALAAEATKLILNGGLRREVAKTVGVEVGVLDYWCQLGLVPRTPKRSAQNPESLRTAAGMQTMLDMGVTQEVVAAHFNMSVSTITRWTQRGLIAKR